MDYLIVGVGNFGLGHQVFEHQTVLNLTHTQNGVVAAVVLCHRLYHVGHIGQFFLVLGLGPLIGAVGQEFIVVLGGVVVYVKQVLKIVKTYHIGTCLRPGRE